MSNILALGSDPLYYYSRCARAVSTDDGNTWTSQPASTQSHTHWIDFATDGTNLVAIGNCNNASHSTNFAIYNDYSWEAPHLQMRRVRYLSGAFHAVGYRKDLSSLAEYATIITSPTGVNQSSWAQTWEHWDSYSALLDMAQLDVGTYLGVGYQNKYQAPLLVGSTNLGSWAQVTLPSNLDSPIHCMECLPSGVVKLGGVGWIAQGTYDGAFTKWSKLTGIQLDKPRAITHISTAQLTSGTVTLALSGSSVFWSNNGSDFTGLSVPGYTFRSLVYLNDQWIIGATTQLNTYTGFRATYTPGTPGLINLEGYRNTVFAYQMQLV